MTVKTRVRRMENTVGGASEYVPLEVLLASVLSDDPKRKLAARRAMKGKKLDPKLKVMLEQLANMPEREASQ